MNSGAPEGKVVPTTLVTLFEQSDNMDTKEDNNECVLNFYSGDPQTSDDILYRITFGNFCSFGSSLIALKKIGMYQLLNVVNVS